MSIVTPEQVFSRIGYTARADEVARMRGFISSLEARFRTFLGCNIVQGTYTHYLPSDDSGLGETLWTPEYPLRSVTSINVDFYGRGGQVAGAFPASTLLTPGHQYQVESHRGSAFSRFGRIRRINALWPSTIGSIKIIYVAGWTPSELAGEGTDPEADASPIQQALLQACGEVFMAVKTTVDSAGLKSQSLAGWSESYKDGISIGISKEATEVLMAFKRKRLL